MSLEYAHRMVTLHEPRPSHSPNEVGVGVVLVLPGAGYSWQAPLLYWSITALVNAGWRVFVTDWERRITTLDEGRACVHDALQLFRKETGASPDLIVGKSLGTLALPWAVENGVPGVWLTPLLAEPTIVEALRIADDRHLAIGGTADHSWRPDNVGRSRAIIRSIPGGDHKLEIGGARWSESAAAQLPLVEQVVIHAARFNRGAEER